MAMFDNVLVGVDGSSGARDAVALAMQLIDSQGKLTLAHVRSGELNPTHAITPGLIREEHAASQQLLEGERAGAEIDTELMSIVGLSVGRALHEQAETQNADLLVVGSSSRGAIGRAMLGDDTRCALNGAPCAVAIAAHGFSGQSTVARVGVAYNASPESEAALMVARALANVNGAVVHALEVVSIPVYGVGLFATPIPETMGEVMDQTNRRLSSLPGVKARAVYGFAGEELAAFGDELDILIVGSRSYGPLKRLVLGSTSDYLERHARCSLLVLPRGLASDSVPDGERSGEARAPAGV